MKRFYPWFLGAAALSVFGGLFFVFFFALFLTATSNGPVLREIPSFSWRTSESFLIFLAIISSAGLTCGLVVAALAARCFEHLAWLEYRRDEMPAPEALTMKKAA